MLIDFDLISFLLNSHSNSGSNKVILAFSPSSILRISFKTIFLGLEEIFSIISSRVNLSLKYFPKSPNKVSRPIIPNVCYQILSFYFLCFLENGQIKLHR